MSLIYLSSCIGVTKSLYDSFDCRYANFIQAEVSYCVHNLRVSVQRHESHAIPDFISWRAVFFETNTLYISSLVTSLLSRNETTPMPVCVSVILTGPFVLSAEIPIPVHVSWAFFRKNIYKDSFGEGIHHGPNRGTSLSPNG